MADPATLAEQAKTNGGGEHAREPRWRAARPAGAARRSPAAPPAGSAAGSRRPARPSPAALLGGVGRRVQRALTADLDDRDPDYIRENLPLAWLAGDALVPGRGAQHGQRPRGGAGAAGRQPHRRQHGARGDHPAARLLDLLRRRAGLLPARPQPGARLAGRAVPAPLRRDGRLARARASAPCRSGAAVLVFPGGDWEVHRPSLGGQQDRLRRPQGLRQAGALRERADRPGGHDRRPGDGALPQPRRLAGEADPGRQAPAPEGDPDLDRAALGPQRRRPARAHPAAGEGDDRGAARRSTCASSSAPIPTSTRSTSTSPA